LVVAEILLQRITATAVAGAYRPFVARCPTTEALVALPAEDIERQISGLGLHECAGLIERAAL
jgi:A/G-specific adenine glycosylase